jgi:hypothetical protein
MSTENRKIGFYGLEFDRFANNGMFFERELFHDFMTHVLHLPGDQQIINIPRYNKAITIERFAITQFHADYVVRIVFKSCKYNHSPEYMSSIDGTERDSDKQPHEGEKEKTHLCIRISTYEAEMILEERRSGVTINEIVNYLNKKLREYLQLRQTTRNFKIIYSIVPSDDFLAALEGIRRVQIAELHTTKTVLGSEAMGLIEYEDRAMKENIVITLKSEAGESLLKRNFKNIYRAITAQETPISRVRLYCTDQNGNPLKLDSSTSKKLDYVTVDLEENGTVSTDSIFGKMFIILGVTGGE